MRALPYFTGNEVTSLSVAGVHVSPRASVVYSPWENQTFRASVSRAFRNPSVIENFVDFMKAGKESYFIVSKFEHFEYAKVAPLFAKLASQALTVGHLDMMERYMRLALKAQNQARATLQTLAELKAPKQVAFVQQANIGNQVQINNGSKSTRTRKKRKAPNELLEIKHGERLDTRATGTAGRIDPAMAAVGAKHWPDEQ